MTIAVRTSGFCFAVSVIGWKGWDDFSGNRVKTGLCDGVSWKIRHEMGVLHGSEGVEVMLTMEGCLELGMQLVMYSRKGTLHWNYRVWSYEGSNELMKYLSCSRTQKFKPQYLSHCTWSWTSPIQFIPSQPLSLRSRMILSSKRPLSIPEFCVHLFCIQVTCSLCLNLFDFNMLTIIGEIFLSVSPH